MIENNTKKENLDCELAAIRLTLNNPHTFRKVRYGRRGIIIIIIITRLI